MSQGPKTNNHASLLKLPLTKKGEANAKESLLKRRDFCMKTIHKAANMLDPMQVQRAAPVWRWNTEGTELICKTVVGFAGLREKDVIEDIANYQGNGGIWRKEFMWKSVSTVLPTVWWNGMCSSRPLSYIASDLLNLHVNGFSVP